MRSYIETLEEARTVARPKGKRYLVNPTPVQDIGGTWWQIIDTHTGGAGTRANDKHAAERMAKRYNERHEREQRERESNHA